MDCAAMGNFALSIHRTQIVRRAWKSIGSAQNRRPDMSSPWPAASIAHAPFRINILTHINRDSGILIAPVLVYIFSLCFD